MRYTRQRVLVALALVSTGCASGIKPPAASQPVLEDVRLVGNRICGPFTSAIRTYAFTCPQLPTTEPSGWQLTPAWAPSVSDPQRHHSNRIAVITVSTPSLTEIDVELAGLGGSGNQSIPLDLVDANLPGNPGEVFYMRQVGVGNTDDGSKKTWKIEVETSTCTDSRHLHVFNRSSSSVARSAPLSVQLIRGPGETPCPTDPVPPPHYRPGVGMPAKPRPTGPCPGGASRTLFQMCENCSHLNPPTMNNYSASQYCDWAEVLDVYGYTGATPTKPSTCKLTQVSSRAACEGPP